MSKYRFTTRISTSQADELGDLALKDDAIACEFGTNIVRDLSGECGREAKRTVKSSSN